MKLLLREGVDQWNPLTGDGVLDSRRPQRRARRQPWQLPGPIAQLRFESCFQISRQTVSNSAVQQPRLSNKQCSNTGVSFLSPFSFFPFVLWSGLLKMQCQPSSVQEAWLQQKSVPKLDVQPCSCESTSVGVAAEALEGHCVCP